MKKIVFHFAVCNKIKTPFTLSLLKYVFCFFLAFTFSLLTFHSNAQGVAISKDGSSAAGSAILDVKSNASPYQGLLIPRLTTTQRDAISSPVESLLIFNTTTKCFEAYVNSAWNIVSCPSACVTPAQPSAITGSANPCQTTSQTYSVTNVAGVTYTWTFPAGWTQTGGGTTNSVTVTVGAGSGNVQVTPSNACGTGTAQTLAVTPVLMPSQPSAITGSTNPCQTTSQTYSVTNVAGVTYTWTFPAGWTQTGGGTTNSVTVTVGAGSGNVQVTPSNACGTGTAQTLAVTPVLVPAQPSAITGNTTPCQTTSQTYSVTNVAGVTYTWTFPAGWTQTGGGTTNSVTVTVGAGSGNVQVIPSNACGNGTAQTLAITPVLTPTQPSAITGNTIICQATSQTYSVTNVAGVTYTWAVPASWSINAGQGTNSITVTAGSTSGNITVTPSNACGSGPSQTLAVTVSSTTFSTCGNPFTDSRDGNIYNTVQIGSQCWMSQNLNYGTYVPLATGQSAAGIQKYCYNDNAANCTTYGGIYEWAEMMNGSASCNGTGSSQPACATPVQGICPCGWHIASHYEWTQLELAVCTDGAPTCAGYYPYDESTDNLRGNVSPYLKAGGSSGFNALESGLSYRPLLNFSGFDDGYGNGTGCFWSSTQFYPGYDANAGWARDIYSSRIEVNRGHYSKDYGMSIRCIKD